MITRKHQTVLKIYKKMARYSHFQSISKYQEVLNPWPITGHNITEIPEEKTYQGRKKQIGFFLDQQV